MRYTITLRNAKGKLLTMETESPVKAAEWATALAVQESGSHGEAWADVKDELAPKKAWMKVHARCGHVADKTGGWIRESNLEISQ